MSPRRRIFSSLLAALGAAVAVSCPSGCGTDGASGLRGDIGNQRPSPIEPVESRVDAVTGMTLILPVRLSGPVAGGNAQEQDLGLTLDDGTKVTSVLRWITVRTDAADDDQGGLRPVRWLPPAGRWRTSDRPPSDPALAMTVLAVDLPEDSAGKDLIIGTRRVKLNWLPSPSLLGADPEVTFAPPIPATLRDAHSLVDLMRPERLSPVRRWRARLMSTGLDPAVLPPLVAGEPRRFTDAVLESMAAQYEARWTIALGMLSKLDPALSAQTAERLCMVTRFPDGTVAPVWPTDQSDLDELLADLLSPSLGPLGRAAAARTWLQSQPPAIAWLIDPAAELDGQTQLPVAWIGLANLTAKPVLAWTTWLDAAEREIGPRPELAPIGPMSWSQMPLSVVSEAVVRSRSTEGGDVRSATLAVHGGTFERRLTVDLARISARPPSVVIGPLVPDLTLDGFVAGTASPGIEPAWSTGAVLYRGKPDPSQGVTSTSASDWVLYIECARPPRDASDAPEGVVDEHIRIHAGPRSRPRMLLRIDETGSAEREDDRGSSGEAVQVRVTREPNRWIALVSLPPDAVEEHGILRLGIERTDSRGVHSAWPRATLPWQDAPARSVVDLRAWDQ